jgi:methylated-DNA-[protein]-cysteine S-methyltransferase
MPHPTPSRSSQVAQPPRPTPHSRRSTAAATLPAREATDRRRGSNAPASHENSPENLATYLFDTPLGGMAMVMHQDTVAWLTFGHGSLDAAARNLPLGLQETIAAPRSARGTARNAIDLLQRYAEGQPVDFTKLPIELTPGTRPLGRARALTAFACRVLVACQQIPYAAQWSYQQLAAQTGSPRAARAVGSVMARNHLPLIIPCHRVVASSGGLGGYSAPQGLTMKRRLLALEARGSRST